MLDGINALIQCVGFFWQSIMSAPLYGSLTWGWFLISVAIMGILVSFFIARLK